MSGIGVKVRCCARLGLVAVVLLVCAAEASAQRLVDRILLNELGFEDFIFDVNSIPVSTTTNEQANRRAAGFTALDLNIAPNVVYSADSSRGFVAVPSSNRIVVFDPATATVETTLEVPANPLLAARTPDGRTAVWVSLLLKRNEPRQGNIFGDRVGALTAVDLDTLATRTLDLEEVTFSTGNNIVFSSDGTTGFLASAATDEIIRFNVATMAENGRLKLQEGSRPSSLTMAPNGVFFGAVLIGSNNLDRLIFPDAISIIEVAGFRQLRTVAPETGAETDNPLLHNFVVYNNLAITPDSRFGVIAEQQASLTSLIPAITPDRAFILDLESGETEGVVPVSGVASGAYAGPDGLVAVVSELQITIIDVPNETFRAVAPQGSAFRPSTRPLFVGREMWVASPILDTLAVVIPKTGEIPRVISVGGNVIRGEGAAARVVPSAPLDVTLTPDGSRATIVNFNATTLDFVEDTERLIFPRVLGARGFFTGVALTNDAPDDSSLILLGHRTGGPLFPARAPNRVFNGDFSSGNLLWTAGEGWTIAEGKATAANASTELSQDISLVADELFEVTFTISNFSGGTVTPRLGGTDGTARSENGTFTELIRAGSGDPPRLRFVGTGFSGEIDNIEVRLEIIKFDNPGSFELPAGTQLALTESEWLMPTAPIDIEGWFDFDSTTPFFGLEIIGDTDLLRMDGAVGVTETGQRWILPEVRIDTPPFPNLLVNPGFTGTAGWTAGQGWTIADGVATASEASGNLEQDPVVTEGTPYKVQFTISNYTAGTLTPVVAGTEGTPRSADGTFVETIVAGDGEATRFQLRATAFSGTVDDVTARQDTPLPDPEGVNTEITLLNPGRNAIAAAFELFRDDGTSVAEVQTILASSGQLINFVRDPDLDSLDVSGLFTDAQLVGFTGGYMEARTNVGMVAFERYLTNAAMSMLPGFNVDNPTATRFVAPQVLAYGDTIGFVTLVNSNPIPPEPDEGEEPPDDVSITVMLTLIDDEGDVIAGPVEVKLEPRQRLRRNVIDLLGLQDPGGGQLISGWLLVEADKPGLVGDVELQLFSRKAMTTIPLQFEEATDLIFSHIVEGLGLLTGLALVNPGDETATVTIEVFRREGDLVDSATIQLDGRHRLARLFQEIFDDLPEMTGGFVRVSADRPVFAVELFFATNTQFLATVPAQIQR